MMDRLRSPHIQIGDHGHCDVAHPKFPSQDYLGHQGHGKKVCSENIPIEAGFGAGGKARAFEDQNRASFVDAQPHFLRGFPQDGPEFRAERVGHGSMHHSWALEKCGKASFGPVDELIGEDEVADLVMGTKPAHGGDGDDPGYAEFVEGPNVGAVRDAVGRQLVIAAVAGEEGHLNFAKAAEGKPGRREAVRGGFLHFPGVRKEPEPINSGAADDGNLGSHGR